MASKKRNKNPLEYHRQERSLGKAKQQHRRVKSQKPPRQRQWDDYVDDEFFEAGTERIMPLDEAERRRRVEAAAGNVAVAEDNSPLGTGEYSWRVIEVSSGMCRVLQDDKVLLCTLRGGLETDSGADLIAVGDRVVVTEMDDEHGRVEAIAQRDNQIVRPHPGSSSRLQVLAANLDQLLIVQAWRSPAIWYELIDRYLIAAARSDVQPVICVNKIDLADDIDHVEAQLAPYRALGYDVILTSVTDGRGLDHLRMRLAAKTTALAGLSGVGKSSLLSAVLPGFELRTGDVNDERGQGRHTTTQAMMMPFGDGYVIDTPGIREFGLIGLKPQDLSIYYPEIADAADSCKFADCTHTHEPGCGVQAELEIGGISEIRYHSYSVIQAELDN